MFLLGVTGGIGSGKSTVTSFLTEAGLPALDADRISHEVTAAGGRAIADIIELLGAHVLQADGSLNRPAVAAVVFKNRRLLDRYSYLVHRHIFAEIDARLLKLEEQKCKACVLDVPIPIKEGFLDRCDIVVAVEANLELRLERLVKRGMSLEDAKRRIQAQLSPEAYREIAQLVLHNDASEVVLKKEIETEIFPLFETRGILLKHFFEAEK